MSGNLTGASIMSLSLINISSRICSTNLDNALEGLDFCFAYVNDILVASKAPEGYQCRLRAAFGRFEPSGLIINVPN